MTKEYEEFTERETDRQDEVDNAIHQMLCDLAPWGQGELIEWDIEDISNVRDVIQEILVDKLKLMTEQQFYPYREI